MIDCLRSKICETSQTGVTPSPDLNFWGNNEVKYHAFKSMVEYYGVTPVIFPTEIVIHATDPTIEREKAVTGERFSDVIHLNVGGTKMATLRSTLTYVQDSMLASRFSGRWDESIEKDKDGDFFIDQPNDLFLAMIDYFRSKMCETPQTGVTLAPDLKFWGNNELKYHAFKNMVEYYGVTHAIYPTEIVIHATDPTTAIVTEYPDVSVSAKDRVICTIESKGHSRRIQSFEVTLMWVGDNMQVGWLCKGCRSDNSIEPYSIYPKANLSHHNDSVALDCNMVGFWFRGNFRPVG